MIGRLIDKLIFGAALLVSLQVPQLADHYHQFLSGLYTATKWQVEEYAATAKQHHYPSVIAMIDHHQQNPVASVRTDAQLKLTTLNQYDELALGIDLFEHGNLIEKSVYMFNPARYDVLKQTLQNFKPGIPLTLEGMLFGVIAALLINFILTLPFTLWSKRHQHQNSHPTQAND